MPTATKTAIATKPTINWFFFKQLSDPRKYFSDSMLSPSRNEWRQSVAAAALASYLPAARAAAVNPVDSLKTE
jgi:hypothetical protein